MINSREKAKLTKRKIDSLEGRAGYRLTLSDTEIPGFRLVVGEHSKTFLLEKRIVGVTRSAKKFTIGRYPAMSVDEARDIAKRWSVLCRDGQDPTRVFVKKKGKDGLRYTVRPRDVVFTLQKAYALHLAYRNLAPATRDSYESLLRTHFEDWLEQPLSEISLEDLLKRGRRIAKRASNATAQLAMSRISALWNTAKHHADSQGISCSGNPLKLVEFPKLFRADHQKIVIPFAQVGRFVAFLEDHKDRPDLSMGKRLALYLYLVSLFLGMRRGEARLLQWQYIDLEAGYFKLPGAIVKNNQTHIKPIGPYALALFRALHEMKRPGNPYVFPSPSQKKRFQNSALYDLNHAQAFVLHELPELSAFSHHALRRTFISMADEICTPRKVLKNLVNHIGGDVTDGYVVKEFNPQKEGPYLERIEQAFLMCRDRFRCGESLPTIAMELFNDTPQSDDAQRIQDLERLLAAKDAELRQAQLENEALKAELVHA